MGYTGKIIIEQKEGQDLEILDLWLNKGAEEPW